VRLSYASSLAVVVLGVTFGWFVGSIDTVIKWIVSALWGGYTAANMLKWYWWRFNGYGYFWGMVAGIGAAMVLPIALPGVSALNAFPLIFVVSLAGCFAGTLLTKPEPDQVLTSFYRRVKPWGFWGPVLAKVRAEDPSFEPNQDFWRDVFNVLVGICWQTSLVALPIYIVTRHVNHALLAFAAVVATSAILKFTWYNKLMQEETHRLPQDVPAHDAAKAEARAAV
jgi:solute:Na+ symporter, SSS family